MVLRLGGADRPARRSTPSPRSCSKCGLRYIACVAPVFLYHAEIAGAAVPEGTPSTFRIVGQEGDLPPRH
jgi:hypothetical protein